LIRHILARFSARLVSQAGIVRLSSLVYVTESIRKRINIIKLPFTDVIPGNLGKDNYILGCVIIDFHNKRL